MTINTESSGCQPLLTQKRLKEKLTYDPHTGVFTWKDSSSNVAPNGSAAGCVNTQGYVVIRIESRLYLAHRLVWLYSHGYFPEHQVDHINRERSGNRIGNLREVTQSCNNINTDNRKDNRSGVKGACWSKGAGKWEAGVRVRGAKAYLGVFADFTEAVAHRLAAEQAENWEGCDSSSPAYLYMTEV